MRKAHSEMLNSKKFMNKTNTEMRYKSTHFYSLRYSFYAKGKKKNWRFHFVFRTWGSMELLPSDSY